MRQLIKTTTAALVIGGSFAITSPAFAAPLNAEIVKTTIDQRDLATDYGVERVYNALLRKAESSCTSPGRVPLSIRHMEKQCTKALLEDFVFDVDNEALTRLYKNEFS